MKNSRITKRGKLKQVIRKKVWEKIPTEKNYLAVKNGIQSVWTLMDNASTESSAVFESNAEMFRKAGIDMIPVADFAWGSGGLHCQMLN
jgi:hypothetical protein